MHASFFNISSNYGTLMRDFTIAILSQYITLLLFSSTMQLQKERTPTAQIKNKILTV
jgi:hypothetical protein